MSHWKFTLSRQSRVSLLSTTHCSEGGFRPNSPRVQKGTPPTCPAPASRKCGRRHRWLPQVGASVCW